MSASANKEFGDINVIGEGDVDNIELNGKSNFLNSKEPVQVWIECVLY